MPLLRIIRRFLVCAAFAGIGSPAAEAAMRMENLSRGLVATRTGNSSAYVGWRLFGTDPDSIAFNLYRSAAGGAPVKLNATPLTASTNFSDTTLNTSLSNRYFVRPLVNGAEAEPSAAFTLQPNSPIRQFLTIPLQIPPGGVTPTGEPFTYSANDVSIGDLTGDGDYEFIVKWDPSNAKDNAQSGYTGNVLLDAYRLDGTRLWRIDLGRNIRAGAHYTQFIVYDLDSDGRAELAVKTAPGTIDGLGQPVLLAGHSPAADYRNSSGYILSGPEYLTVFDGRTGANLATTRYIVPRHPTTESPTSSQLNAIWGDGYGNRVDRFNAAVAYLDGQRPSLVMARGIYTRTAVAAWDWREGKLTQRWLFDTHNNSSLATYAGQGNHQISIADADGDGKHEIIYGAMTLDDDGTGLYSSRLGHGDTLHAGDFDPLRPGLEIFSPFESPGSNGNIGTAMRDAKTGAVLWSTHATSDVGRGVTMDIDPRYPGTESWATNNSNIYSATGEIIARKPSNMFHNFGVWWDADLLRELLDGTTISKWNHLTSGRSNIFLPWQHGATSNNGTKNTPALSGDILGDWREEVVYRNSDSSALLIFTTTSVTTHRLFTFLHDPQYRIALAWQNVAYNQPPHPSFFVGAGMNPPPRPNIRTDAVRSAPAGLRWAASVNTTWDSSTPNWTRTSDGASENFQDGDSVRFDDTAASLDVSIAFEVSPGSIAVETSQPAYSFSGAPISGTGTLTKLGPGTLRIAQSNTYSGGTTLSAGALVLGHANAAGSGPITLAGGTLATGTLSPPNPLVVTADSTITGGHSGGSHAIFNLSGSQNLSLAATNVFDLEGNMAGFTGRILLGGSGSFRFFGSAGSAAASFDLGTRTLSARSGSAFALGTLSGSSGSVLQGASGTGNNTAVTYTIGARNEDSIFSGAIVNGNSTTAIHKTGAGLLTLAGTHTYTGPTTISAGAICLTGSLANTPVMVMADAGFGGSGSHAGSLAFQSGSTLLFGVTPAGVAGVSVAGSLSLEGTIKVSPALIGGELAPGTHTILTRTSGSFTGSPTWVWAPPADTTLEASFDTSTPGQLKLTLTRPPSPFEIWLQSHFTAHPDPAASAPAADPDHDGMANLLEYAFGSSPLAAGPSPVQVAISDGELSFTFPRIADPALSYTIEASPDLVQWTQAWTSSGEENAAGVATIGPPDALWPDGTRFLRMRIEIQD